MYILLYISYMSINFATIAPMVATLATAGGLIFQIGTHMKN